MQFYKNTPAKRLNTVCQSPVFSALDSFFPLDIHSLLSAEDSRNIQSCEEDRFFKLSLDVPGIDPKNIKICVQDGSLSISTQDEKTNDTTSLNRQFSTSITLPPEVDHSSISANCENGVLEVILPKKAKAQAKEIAVRAGSSKTFIEDLKKRWKQ